MREPTKEVQVDMSFKGHNFTTFLKAINGRVVVSVNNIQ